MSDQNKPSPKRAGISLKGLPFDLLLDSGVSPETLPRVDLLKHGGYVFFLTRLMREHNVVPRGVIHLGANIGQESVPYMLMNFEKVLYVEAHPGVYDELKRNIDRLTLLENEMAAFLRTKPVTRFATFNGAVGDHDGETRFFVTNSTLFSSTRKPVDFSKWVDYMLERSTPSEAAEFVSWADTAFGVSEETTVPVRKLDTIMREELPDGWRAEDFNVLGMNLQGGELDALRGAENTLSHVEFIQTEMNYGEHYQGNPMPEEINHFLTSAGFHEVMPLRAGPVGTSVYVRCR
ncbi:MAG TPA: FkbM family methyltransferase [Candidatus Angelobacter sp.]|nr:FkbM family methyltransferase [Candidatus Angelobacter sp.]